MMRRGTTRWIVRCVVFGLLPVIVLAILVQTSFLLRVNTLDFGGMRESSWEERSLRGLRSSVNMNMEYTQADIENTLARLTRQGGSPMRILVAAIDQPDEGPGPTGAYYLVKHLRERYRLTVTGVFFSRRVTFLNDPLGIGGCFAFSRYDVNASTIWRQRSLIRSYLGGSPDVVVAIAFRATLLSHALFPGVFIVQVTTGSMGLSDTSQSFQRIMWNWQFKPRTSHIVGEKEALSLAGEMHYVSVHVWRAYEHLYPGMVKGPQGLLDLPAFTYDVVTDVLKRGGPWKGHEEAHEDDFDVAFVVNNIHHRVENVEMMERIFFHPKIQGLRKLIIGRDAVDYCQAYPNTLVYDSIPHAEVLWHLSRTRVLIVPSFFEGTATTAVEAVAMGAVPVVSKNVGSWQTFPSDVVCGDVYDVDEWIQAIEYGLEHRESILATARANALRRRDQFLYQQLPSLLGRGLDRLAVASVPDSPHRLFRLPDVGRPLRFVCASTQRPFYGGSATNAYYTTQLLRRQYDAKVAAVFFGEGDDSLVDPSHIKGVFHVRDLYFGRDGTTRTHDLRKAVEKYLGGPVDAAFGFNFQAPPRLRTIFPTARILFVVVGSEVLLRFAESKVPAVNALERFPLEYRGDQEYHMPGEVTAAVRSDELLFVSPLLQETFRVVYPEIAHIPSYVLDVTSEMTDFTQERLPSSLSWSWSWWPPSVATGKGSGEAYDLVFVVSRVDREVKNPELVMRLYNHPRLRDLPKAVVGKGAVARCDAEGLINTAAFELQSHDEVIALFARSRILLIPSWAEGSPNTAVEAVASGCLPLMSPNVGMWETFPEELVCRTLTDLDEWVERIDFILRSRDDLLRRARRAMGRRQQRFFRQLNRAVVRNVEARPEPEPADGEMDTHFGGEVVPFGHYSGSESGIAHWRLRTVPGRTQAVLVHSVEADFVHLTEADASSDDYATLPLHRSFAISMEASRMLAEDPFVSLLLEGLALGVVNEVHVVLVRAAPPHGYATAAATASVSLQEARRSIRRRHLENMHFHILPHAGYLMAFVDTDVLFLRGCLADVERQMLSRARSDVVVVTRRPRSCDHTTPTDTEIRVWSPTPPSPDVEPTAIAPAQSLIRVPVSPLVSFQDITRSIDLVMWVELPRPPVPTERASIVTPASVTKAVDTMTAHVASVFEHIQQIAEATRTRHTVNVVLVGPQEVLLAVDRMGGYGEVESLSGANTTSTTGEDTRRWNRISLISTAALPSVSSPLTRSRMDVEVHERASLLNRARTLLLFTWPEKDGPKEKEKEKEKDTVAACLGTEDDDRLLLVREALVCGCTTLVTRGVRQAVVFSAKAMLGRCIRPLHAAAPSSTPLPVHVEIEALWNALVSHALLNTSGIETDPTQVATEAASLFSVPVVADRLWSEVVHRRNEHERRRTTPK